MKNTYFFLIIILLLSNNTIAQGWKITSETSMPEPVSNNAVVEGFVNATPYVYSFMGIGAGKTFSDIHLKSWRYNTLTQVWEALSNVPDTMGKVASGASRVGDTIYIIGGYHVFANGQEKSSSKVHRFDIQQNTFITDGEPCPIGIDDHVQVVYQDSLIYVVTGWSDNQNVNKAYVYHPRSDFWEEATNLPNNNTYKSFGASGSILRDTLFYYGGASQSFGFPAQFALRKGVISPNDPTEINWTVSIPNNKLLAYRAACLSINNEVHWLGGSQVTYNYNGLAYSNNQPVSNSERDLIWGGHKLKQAFHDELNMDYRGVAATGNDTFYLVGGMDISATVSSKTLRLVWNNSKVSKPRIAQPQFHWYPNPVHNYIKCTQTVNDSIFLYNALGKLIQSYSGSTTTLSTKHLESGVYLILWNNGSHRFVKE